jgi:hypothetical protein
MLARTPVVGEFDLAAENWDEEPLPHYLAAMITIAHGFRQLMDLVHTGAPPRRRYRNVDVRVTVRVKTVYNEPKALLLAYCQFMAARGGAGDTKECCVCMEDLAAPTDGDDDSVMLPCSHVFHNQCLVPWFSRRSTCPMCRRNVIVRLKTESPGELPPYPYPCSAS